MEQNVKPNERISMTALQQTPAIPAHPNIVEMAALLEDPNLLAKDRTSLRRELHDTVHFVKKQDSRTHSVRPQFVVFR
jgi:hypothetical protein